MSHLDFVALREPVTCTLPTDPPDRKRLVRQFRRLELEQFEVAKTLQRAGDDLGALDVIDALCRFAVEGITDQELDTLATVDKVRLLGAATGKIDLVEAALGNGPGGGDASSPTAPPPPITAASTTTTPAAPLQAG